MTTQRSFKARIRARMDKTGESYTTARRQLLARATPAAPPAPEAVQPQRRSEATVRERTGRGWDEWFALLDEWGATGHSHTEIAHWLVTEHRVDNWWSQTITVGYEQARGMRAPGQLSDGFFSVNGSRTVAVPVERLFDAFADESIRRQWLPGATVRIRTATAPRSLRADWADGTTRIVVSFTPKGDGRAQVALVHEKVPDADTAGQLKAHWRDRLTALKQLLES